MPGATSPATENRYAAPVPSAINVHMFGERFAIEPGKSLADFLSRPETWRRGAVREDRPPAAG